MNKNIRTFLYHFSSMIPTSHSMMTFEKMNIWGYIPMSISHLALSLVSYSMRKVKKTVAFEIFFMMTGRRGQERQKKLRMDRCYSRRWKRQSMWLTTTVRQDKSDCQTQTKIMDSPQFSNLDFITTALHFLSTFLITK